MKFIESSYIALNCRTQKSLVITVSLEVYMAFYSQILYFKYTQIA